MDSQLTLLATLTALILAFGYLLRARSTSSAPPGPPAHPILGHALIFPKQLSWERFHAWSKEYNSDIIQLSMLGTNVVILDTLQATKELLDKRSSTYSSRPRMPMVTELMGWDFNLGTMPYGSRWRAHRKLFERSFHANADALYEPKSLKASRELVESLWHEPERFLDHFRHMAGSVILSVTYGIQTQMDNDPFVKLSEAGIKPVLEAVVPGTYLVDTFPILKYIPDWMPFAGFKKVAKKARKASMAMVELPFEHAKRTMVEQNVAPSFVSTRLQNMENATNPEEEERIKNTAATMYSAGFDNIISTLTGFVLGILENPEAQTKAQTEIDSVLLDGELPTFDDKDSLPYVTAITMEVFRWAISSPIGAPHVLISDDVYNGYHLKSGTLVFANIWAILHDEKTYPNPFKFNPDRFLENGRLKNANEADMSAFGFGRRICPGRFMGFSTIWIAVVSILSTCEISKAVDEEGNIIAPIVAYNSSTSCAQSNLANALWNVAHDISALSEWC